MAYYVISFEPGVMELFQKRISFLQGAQWIKEKKNLADVKPSFGNEAVFFVFLSKDSQELDEWILIIRDLLTSAKIIYVVEESNAHDLKAHQLTPVGGDAYVPLQADEPGLEMLLDGLTPPKLNPLGNRLNFSVQRGLDEMRHHPKSKELDKIFTEVIGNKIKKVSWQSSATLAEPLAPDEGELGEVMSDKDKELSLDDMGDLELTMDPTVGETQEEEGLELSLDDDEGLDLSDTAEASESDEIDEGLDLDFGHDLSAEDEDEEVSLSDDDSPIEDLGELSLGDDELPPADFSLSDEDMGSLSLDADEGVATPAPELSDDAMEKLKEIDALMDLDASQASIKMDLSKNGPLGDSDIDKPLVSDDLDLGSLSFTNEEAAVAPKSKKKGKEKDVYEGNVGQDLKDISGAYSGEIDRIQATMSNLRSDREELLAKIQKLEEEKLIQSRQTLTMRAELDEKKIELSIIRKKLNDEISELKDRLKLFEEKKLILEEKNKILMVEVDKAAQKNRIDVKKVQMRERELEQKLELLKADSETQIRHRDLKILDLKRKLDAMEFDIESISVQEKRSVESRFELEDKLDKAIKTLRSAISVLEDETDKSGALDALKKSIDM